jgi:hypothetical protein
MGGGMKAKVSIVWGVDEADRACEADDVDAAAAAEAGRLLSGGKIKKKETLIDRISRRFSTIENRSSERDSGAGVMQAASASGTGFGGMQQQQVA